jgi:hypothetical protein
MAQGKLTPRGEDTLFTPTLSLREGNDHLWGLMLSPRCQSSSGLTHVEKKASDNERPKGIWGELVLVACRGLGSG